MKLLLQSNFETARFKVARLAERKYFQIATQFENEFSTKIDRIKYVRFTVDRPPNRRSWEQRPYSRLYPGLTARPFWALSAFPNPVSRILKEVVRASPIIRRELLESIGSAPWTFGRTGSYGPSVTWRIAELLSQSGEFSVYAKTQSPTLLSFLEKLLALHGVGKVYFSLLPAGAELPLHSGATNSFLRLHLGIDVPTGDVGIQVGKGTRKWTNGRTIVFDDSYGHKAWNFTDRDRIILLARLLHPDFSLLERHAIRYIHQRFSNTEEFHRTLMIQNSEGE